MLRTRRELHDGWRLTLARPGADAPLTAVDAAATVPGCVHLDLIAAGLLDDPYVDRREHDQHWIGESDWTYSLRFDHTRADAERVDLVFDGLDTVAVVELNGRDVLRTFDMHRTHRVDVTAVLRASGNDLVLAFASPVAYALAQRAALGDLPNPYGEPYNFIRKAAANFGWDWGPRLTTAGIWRPVAIESWSGARLAAVRPTVGVDADGTGVVDLAVKIERVGAAGPVRVRASVAGTVVDAVVPPGEHATHLRLTVPAAERWWPVGRGAQPLYDIIVTASVDGAETDAVTRRIGFRSVTVDTTPLDDGSRWAMVVNGERLWVRGFNWIPDDCFPTRVTPDRVVGRLDQAIAANANLVRVWGGGIYESDAFYDACDERGLLVWQDFAFACAAYPEDALHDEVAAEAADNVDRLMSHPSLALWCGNNENVWGWWDWGWPAEVGDRPWGLGFYADLLPGIVRRLDPGRPYLLSSPSSGDLDRHPNDPAHGPIHIWDVWNDLDYEHYRTYRPRFVSEFGFQAPPTLATLEAGVSTRPLRLDDPNLANHQKATDGDGKLGRALAHHFGDVTDVDDWLFLTQVNQARALATGFGHLRGQHERCAGAVWWQLNDGWPVVSWAVVDGGGRLKPAWYAARRAFADRTLVIDPTGDTPTLVAVNDSRAPWTAALDVVRVDLAGTVLARYTAAVTVGPDAAVRVALPASVARPQVPAAELLVATLDGVRAVHTWVLDRQLVGPPAASTAVATPTIDGVVVDVTATTVVRDLCLFADRLHPDATVDDQLVTLLPGETHRFTVWAPADIDTTAATHPPVLRAANDALARRGVG